MMKPKHQRLALALLAVAALIAAAVLALSALQEEAAYFYTPAEVTAGKARAGVPMRLGGLVRTGSIRRGADGVTVRFVVEDRAGAVPVSYRGITPDLFVEGSGVVAEGQLAADGRFVADNLLAKHDENYRPRELEGMGLEEERAAAKTLVTAEERRPPATLAR